MKKEYYYKGNKLYNIKRLDWDYCGYDILANWKDESDDNKEKLGKFRMKELATVLKAVEFPLDKDGNIEWDKKLNLAN